MKLDNQVPVSWSSNQDGHPAPSLNELAVSLSKLDMFQENVLNQSQSSFHLTHQETCCPLSSALHAF